MIDPKDVTLLLPISDLRGDRLGRFCFLMDILKSIPFGQVIVSERFRPPIGQCRANYWKPDGWEWLYEASTGAWNKSAAINAGLLRAKCRWVWIHDGDVLLPFEAVLQMASGEKAGIQPFRKIMRLDEKQSQAKMRGETLKLKLKETKCCMEFGGGSLIVSRKAALEVRGFDERFEGWGGEDVEFGRRFASVFSVEVLSPIRGFHLYHPPVPKSDRVQVRDSHDRLVAVSGASCATNPLAYIMHGVKSRITADKGLLSLLDSKKSVSMQKWNGAAVVVSTFPDYACFLKDAVDSVEKQVGGGWVDKFLVCDHCKPPEWLPADWHVIEGEWHAPGPGRTIAAKATSAGWLCCLDADDALGPNYLGDLSKVARTASPAVAAVYPDLHWCGPDLQSPVRRNLSEWDPKIIRRSNFVPTPSLWKVSAILECGGWPSGTPVMDDWSMMIRANSRGYIAVHCPTSSPAVLVRKHDTNRSRLVPRRVITSWESREFAIVTLFSGLHDQLEMWKRWMEEADLPDRLRVYAVDNSGKESFSRALWSVLQEAGVRRRTKQISVVTAPDPLTPDAAGVHTPHMRVPCLYNEVIPQAVRSGDLILLWEDDVVPPLDGLRKLHEPFIPDVSTRIGAIAGLYLARGGDRLTLSSDPARWIGNICVSDIQHGLCKVGGVAGGFTLFDAQALAETLPFRFTWDPDGTAVGWDGNVSRQLQASNWELLYHGDVLCEHHVSQARYNPSDTKIRSLVIEWKDGEVRKKEVL